MRRISMLATIAAVLGAASAGASAAWACPFCPPVTRTLGEDLAAADVVVFARLAGSNTASSNIAGDSPARFHVERILKGESLLDGAAEIEAPYVGEAAPGSWFLLTAAATKKLEWSSPVAVSPRAREYIPKMLTLPASGVERLAFFLPLLEDADEMLAQEAFDEFAKSPYADVIALGPQMNSEQLVAWIKDPAIPATRRRLYFTLLGVCGGPEHLPLLEEMLQSKERQELAGLDAMIACYLTLKGADGLPLIEERFLKNREAEYTDAYSAVMAIRFHGTESSVIPRDRLAAALRHLLDRPDLADLVIPDLARWEDWKSMDRLVALFKESDEKTSWVRMPIINYLRACPLPEARQRIEELKQIDPEAVEKTLELFPASPPVETVSS